MQQHLSKYRRSRSAHSRCHAVAATLPLELSRVCACACARTRTECKGSRACVSTLTLLLSHKHKHAACESESASAERLHRSLPVSHRPADVCICEHTQARVAVTELCLESCWYIAHDLRRHTRTQVGQRTLARQGSRAKEDPGLTLSLSSFREIVCVCVCVCVCVSGLGLLLSQA